MQAIERIRAALKHLKDVPGSLKTGLGIDEYRAACRPVAMSEVLSHITALEAENERLKDLADSEGSRAVEYLRRARNVEAEVERLRKDAERLDYIEESGNFGVTRYRSGPGGPVLIEAEDGKKDISKSASSLRDAIDSVIKEAKGTP